MTTTNPVSDAYAELYQTSVCHALDLGTGVACDAVGGLRLLDPKLINCPDCLKRIAAKAAWRERVRLDRLAPHELHPTTLYFLVASRRSSCEVLPSEVIDVVYRGGLIPRGRVPSTRHVAVLIEAHLRGRAATTDLGEHSGDGVRVPDLGPDVAPSCLCHLEHRDRMQPWEEPRWSSACPLPRPNQPPMTSSRSAL